MLVRAGNLTRSSKALHSSTAKICGIFERMQGKVPFAEVFLASNQRSNDIIVILYYSDIIL